MHLFMLFLLGLCLGGCSKAALSVRSEAIHPEYLASLHVGTPDPFQEAFCGQQIIVQWSFPEIREPLSLLFSFILGNHTFEQVCIPLNASEGYYIYRLLGSAFREKGGILSYKVEVLTGSKKLACWQQQSWVEWIDP